MLKLFLLLNIIVGNPDKKKSGLFDEKKNLMNSIYLKYKSFVTLCLLLYFFLIK